MGPGEWVEAFFLAKSPLRLKSGASSSSAGFDLVSSSSDAEVESWLSFSSSDDESEARK